MLANQKSIRGNIEDFMCPFTDVYITQGSYEGNHKGIKATDIRGINPGVRYPYYAPCLVKCVWIYPSSGQAMWQSVNKVRIATGEVDYITFMTVHDNSFNCFVGMTLEQGAQIGNMGDLGQATGVHTHIQIAKGRYNINEWQKNKYDVYMFPNELEFEEACFMDNTNIIHGIASWKYLKDVKVDNSSNVTTCEEKYTNIVNENKILSSKITELQKDILEKEKEINSLKNDNQNELLLVKQVMNDGIYAIKLYSGEQLYISKKDSI